jgi:DUF1680 family protein
LDDELDNIIAKMTRAQMPDGYLNSHYQTVKPHARWTSLRHDHELYCAGHLLEAAVAHAQATGKNNYLDLLLRYVHHIEHQFLNNPKLKRAYDGHEEIEIALMRLYDHTGNARYLNLAQHFVDVRGQGRSVLGHNPTHADVHFYDVEARRQGEDPRDYWAKSYDYLQAHKPVREHDEIVGHAVRAVYLYAAVADLAREQNDAGYLAACERVWNHLMQKRFYVTGGLGVAAKNEGFTTDYDLPDDTAYAETCASIGLVFWAQRMLNITGESKYADAIERALYNNICAGISLDGTQYNYDNPLAYDGSKTHRQDWYDCACCPPNVARLFASVGNYFYSNSDDALWVHLFAEGAANTTIHGKPVTLRVTTNYPWDGKVKFVIECDEPISFALNVRLPDWCAKYQSSIKASGKSKGYLQFKRTWKSGDSLVIDFEMNVLRIYANPQVKQMIGRVAIQRGPMIYCAESIDQPALLDLHRVFVRQDAKISLTRVKVSEDTEVVALDVAADILIDSVINSSLYSNYLPMRNNIILKLIPYAYWDNRTPGAMRVWLRE